jgi:hypothetical protein
MSVVTWETPKGNIGTIPQLQFYDFQLSAVDSDEQQLYYSFISGQLPPGLYITTNGMLRGTPSLSSPLGETTIYSFTVRASTETGYLADRSFSLNVSNTSKLQIVLENSLIPDLIGAWFDGSYMSHQFTAINENPSANTTWRINSGELPPGITLSTTGLLSGYMSIIAANTTELGYDVAPEDTVVYDAPPKSTDKYYNFSVQATDGFKITTTNVRMLVVSKGNYTADNDITAINDTFITIDADNKYRPIILNSQSSIPVLVSNSVFLYKFIAYDPEGEEVSWEIDELAFSGMDELDGPVTQEISGNGTTGPFLLTKTISAFGILVYYNDVLLTQDIDYTLAGNQITYVTILPTAEEIVRVEYMSGTTGFDSILFDQGASGLPTGLTINSRTGWIHGVLPAQVEDITTYNFNLTAYRTAAPEYRSDVISFTITVKRDVNEEIIWNSDSNLGVLDNGQISEIAVSATNTLGKELEYNIIYEPYRKIPQGLKFLKSGRFTGRTSFRYFSLDGGTGWLNVSSTENLEVGMQVQGPSVASGCRITEIVDFHTIAVEPAIYVVQGTTLTFTSATVTQIETTTTNAITTAIDGGNTTFDQICKFTVKASAVDGSISSNKTFTVTVNPYNLAPYENIYLRALPSTEQRALYNSISKDTYIFPENLIYRPDDPLFGVSKTFKFLFMAGLSSSNAETFVNAIQNNHYTKTINFGNVKTAIAKDDNGNIVYEVVYVEAEDLQAFNTVGPPPEISLNIENGYLYNGTEYKTIYPNSFINMDKRVGDAIGFTNRGALPKWMTSVQENGLVLGITRAVVLAYVVPGASKLISYRLSNNLLENDSRFTFVADRYQWDNSLSKYYDTTTNRFLPSKQTTFDKYTTTQTRSDVLYTTIVTAVTNSTTITVPEGISCGVGWSIVSQDVKSSIPTNTVITEVSGTTLTLSKSITADADALVKINGVNEVDYAVSVPYNNINGKTLTYIRESSLIDGVFNFAKNEFLIFTKQQDFPEEPSDGWVEADGTVIPGFLEKTSGTSIVNKRGGIWQINWETLPNLGFDDDSTGFDEASDGFKNGYFDQRDDSEVSINFVNEILVNQSVKVRTGKTYPSSVLTYRTANGKSIPDYISISGTTRTAETSFDGGSCICREKDIQNNVFGIAGGTRFGSNTDKYIVPESQDKYIKFPKDGVFV